MLKLVASGLVVMAFVGLGTAQADKKAAKACSNMDHTMATHTHKEGCGHEAVKHDDHVDYLHDKHLHKVDGDHYDECKKVEAKG
jgi:hypothetical protein